MSQRAQHFMPAQHFLKSLSERRQVERAVQTYGQRDVVNRRGRVELLKKPQALLREREREVILIRALGDACRSRDRDALFF